jgi:ribonuclease J
MINQLFKQGAQVLYESVHAIHASGHATRPELKQMIEWTRPEYFVPIHGEYRHLVHHARVAEEAGVAKNRVKVISDGEVLELGTKADPQFEVSGKLEEHRILVENREGTDISKLVLKDRRQLGEKGVVFALLVRSREDLRIIAGPQVLSRGLVNEQVEGWMIEEATALAKKVGDDYEAGVAETGAPPFDLAETLRIELRRFFNQNLGKKPMVLPMIIDL